MFRVLPPLVASLIVAAAVGSGSQASASAPARATTAGERLLVRFDAGTSAAARNAALARVGGRKLATIRQLGIAVVSVPARASEAAVHELEASPVVSYVETDGSVRADGISVDDPYLGTGFWQLANLHLSDAWSLSTGSAGAVIAVLDTGVDRSHEDLGAFAPGYDFVNGDSDPSDDNGHGTAVAGIIGAQGGNGKGSAGVCWKCTIMPVKVLGAGRSGTWSDVAAGVTWATNHGAKVINMSFGLPSGSHSMADAVNYAESHGVVVVASAGNEDSSAPDYPAAYPGVLSVGAVDETGIRYSSSNGNTDYGNWGSNYGSWVQVDAPGCVNSTWPADPAHPSGNYTYFCGTSAAAPFVSGLAGLTLSYVPTASATEVASAIESTAHQTADNNSAHGLIDTPAAMTALAAVPPGSTVSFTQSAISGKAPLTVRFTNTSTKAGSYLWSFGDGTTSANASPKHLYRQPGTFTATLTSGGTSASVQIAVAAGSAKANRSRGKISVRLTRKTFERSQAGKVKLVYRFSAPSSSFGYRLERENGAGWMAVHSVTRSGDFGGSHTLTVRQLFGAAQIASGRYRLRLSSDAGNAQLGFVTR